jgi:hypothetical protein
LLSETGAQRSSPDGQRNAVVASGALSGGAPAI